MCQRAINFATVIVAGWRLGTGSTKIPGVENTLDLALKQIAEHRVLERYRDDLVFVTGTATRCPFLNDALDTCMLSLDSSTFTEYKILISENAAEAFLRKIGTKKTDAGQFGQALHGASEMIQRELVSFTDQNRRSQTRTDPTGNAL